MPEENQIIRKSILEHIDTVCTRLEKFSDGLFIDGNTIDKAIKYVKDKDLLEELLDEETGKSVHYKIYKEANELIKPIMARVDLPIKSIRQKIFNWIKSGAKHKSISLKKNGYEIIIDNKNLVPETWWKKEIDTSLIESTADAMDGKLVIPGVTIKKKEILVIRAPKEK